MVPLRFRLANRRGFSAPPHSLWEGPCAIATQSGLATCHEFLPKKHGYSPGAENDRGAAREPPSPRWSHGCRHFISAFDTRPLFPSLDLEQRAPRKHHIVNKLV